MQIDQNFELPVAPEQAWEAFKNIELLVECLPGAALTGPAVEGELPLRFDVKMGPISTHFLGSGRVVFDDLTNSGRFEGAAADKRTGSRVKGAASFTVMPHGSGSRVEVSVDYNLTGSLAQFSRGGIVRELAAALTAQFAANLATRLQAAVASEHAAAASATATATAVVPAGVSAGVSVTAPLNAGSLLRQMLKARWQRLWNMLLRRKPA